MNIILPYLLTNFITTGLYLNDSFRNEDNFIASLLVMGLLVFLIIAVIGIVLGLLFIAVLIGLISAGIISASLLVGLQQKSISSGFKTFFLSISIVGCTTVSVLFFWFINTVKNWWDTNIAIIAGVFFGLISGWLIGLLLFKVTKKITLFIKTKYFPNK